MNQWTIWAFLKVFFFLKSKARKQISALAWTRLKTRSSSRSLSGFMEQILGCAMRRSMLVGWEAVGHGALALLGEPRDKAAPRHWMTPGTFSPSRLRLRRTKQTGYQPIDVRNTFPCPTLRLRHNFSCYSVLLSSATTPLWPQNREALISRNRAGGQHVQNTSSYCRCSQESNTKAITQPRKQNKIY